METLLTAEKHSHPGQTLNDFRRLLACDALPLLGSAPVELNPRLALRLLCKAVEFYLAYIQQPPDPQIPQPWERLFQVIESVGKKLGWELSVLFASPWNQDLYSERLHKYAASHSSALGEEVVARQLLICTTIVLLRVLNDHNSLISNSDVGYCLVEAFSGLCPSPAGNAAIFHSNFNSTTIAYSKFPKNSIKRNNIANSIMFFSDFRAETKKT